MKNKRSSSATRNNSLKSNPMYHMEEYQRQQPQNPEVNNICPNQVHRRRRRRAPSINDQSNINSSYDINFIEKQVSGNTAEKNITENTLRQYQRVQANSQQQCTDWNSQNRSIQEIRVNSQQNQESRQQPNPTNSQQKSKQTPNHDNIHHHSKQSPSPNNIRHHTKQSPNQDNIRHHIRQSSNQDSMQDYSKQSPNQISGQPRAKQYSSQYDQQPKQQSNRCDPQQPNQSIQSHEPPSQSNFQNHPSRHLTYQNGQQNHQTRYSSNQNGQQNPSYDSKQFQQVQNEKPSSKPPQNLNIDNSNNNNNGQPRHSSLKSKPVDRPVIDSKAARHSNSGIGNNNYIKRSNEAKKEKDGENSDHDNLNYLKNDKSIKSSTAITTPISHSREISKINSSPNITSNLLPCSKFVIDNEISITYYIDNTDPPKITGKIIGLLNDKRILFRKHVKKPKVNVVKHVSSDDDFGERPPIFQFSLPDVNKSETDSGNEEESENSYDNQIDSSDLMAKYWPKISESQRAFQNEYSLTNSTRVASIRDFNSIRKNAPTPIKEQVASPVPQKFIDCEKKYLVNPPSPASPYHSFPRKINKNNAIKLKYTISTPNTKNTNDHLCLTTPPHQLEKVSSSEIQNAPSELNENENEDDEKDSNQETDKNEDDVENKIEDDFENKVEDENNENYLDANHEFLTTNKKFSKRMKDYQDLIDAFDDDDIFANIQCMDKELQGCNNMTSIQGPLFEEEMTVIRYNNLNCEIIENIIPKAFFEFRFGNCVYYDDDISPDELHLNAWHNLNINPDKISISLDKFIENNIHGKIDMYNIFGVLRYVLKWIQFYPDDFTTSPNCASHTCMALDRVIKKSPQMLPRSYILKSLIRSIAKQNTPYSAVKMPFSKITIISSEKYRKISIYEKIFSYNTKKEIRFLVNHFAYVDLCLLRQMLRSELIQVKFLKNDKKMFSCPHYDDITNRFNIMARFVTFSILSVVRNYSSSLEKKVKVRIEFWINVMKISYDSRNFSLLYEIDAGLLNPAIKRLKNIWKTVKNVDQFEKLHEITLPISSNMKKCIDLIMEKPEDTVPYIGLFLTKLKYLSENNKRENKMKVPQSKLDTNLDDKKQKRDQLIETKGYNMAYQYFLSKEISKIFQNWGINYKFTLDESLLQVIKNISFTCDDPRLMEFSNQILSPDKKE